MIHYLDIPKTTKNDEGTIRCIAKNQSGEVETKAKLRVNPKTDFRTILRNVKTGEPVVIESEPSRDRGMFILLDNIIYRFLKNLFCFLKIFRLIVKYLTACHYISHIINNKNQ